MLIKGLFVYVGICIQSTYNGYLSICVEISKEYGHGLAMLGSLVMCTVYTTNKLIVGPLKLILGIEKQIVNVRCLCKLPILVEATTIRVIKAKITSISCSAQGHRIVGSQGHRDTGVHKSKTAQRVT